MVSPAGTVSAIWLPDLKESDLFSKTREYLDAYIEWRESPCRKLPSPLGPLRSIERWDGCGTL